MGEKKETKEPECDKNAKSPNVKSCPPIRNVTHPLRYYEFTKEEIKALEECDKESFYQRCLPLSTLFASLTFAAVRAEFLSRNPHFGPAPKMIIGGVLGYLLGRYSYIQACEEKLRELPAGSHLGSVMRAHYLERNPPPPPSPPK